jgi:hypothetical protein
MPNTDADISVGMGWAEGVGEKAGKNRKSRDNECGGGDALELF